MKLAVLIPSLIVTISLSACSAETSKKDETLKSVAMDKSEVGVTSKSNVTTKSVQTSTSKAPLQSKTVDPVTTETLIYDISGLKIGMTQSEVEDVAKKNGYSLTSIFPGLSFEQTVNKHMGKYVVRKKYEGIGIISFQKDDREFLQVSFLAFKTSSRVTSINYSLKDANMGPEQFRDRVVAKYGEAHDKDNRHEGWIGAQNYQIEGIPAPEHLLLSSSRRKNSGHAQNSIMLAANIDKEAYEKVLDAAIPKSKGVTTF